MVPADDTHADRLLTGIHADYIEAGADVITANTFASSQFMLFGAGLAEETDEINRRAVAAALHARDAHERGAQVVVAGSLSHMMPMTAGTATSDPRTVPSDSRSWTPSTSRRKSWCLPAVS